VSSVLVGMGARERTERVGPENMMAVFGVQEWFKSAASVHRQRPKGSNVGVVRVRVFRSTRDVRVWIKGRGSLLPE